MSPGSGAGGTRAGLCCNLPSAYGGRVGEGVGLPYFGRSFSLKQDPGHRHPPLGGHAVTTDPITARTLATVNAFNDAFNRHDVDAVMALMTEDVVFDSTRPPPDGERLVGQAAVRGFWEAMFARSPQARFETEEMVGTQDRCVVRWVYHWVRDGQPGHVRGIDLFRVRDGKVAEKFSYVKG